MNDEITLYHFTKHENLQSIFRDGLLCDSRFLSLGSRLRNNVSYLWLSPNDDNMAHKDNVDFVYLEVLVDAKLCFVANMDLISAAFVNFMMEKNDKNPLYDYNKLVVAYDTSAVKYRDYGKGMFRAPEVLVQGNIAPEKIKIAKPYEPKKSCISNRSVYNASIKAKNLSFKAMEKVAVHDDSMSLLHTYKIVGENKFVTFEEDMLKYLEMQDPVSSTG